MKDEALNDGKSKPYLHSQTKINNYWDKSLIYVQKNHKNKPIRFYDWFITHIQPEFPDPFYIYRNGHFAVRKDLILKKSLDYYKKLILEVNHHTNPEEGQFLERSWYYIFD